MLGTKVKKLNEVLGVEQWITGSTDNRSGDAGVACLMQLHSPVRHERPVSAQEQMQHLTGDVTGALPEFLFS